MNNSIQKDQPVVTMGGCCACPFDDNLNIVRLQKRLVM